MIHLHERYKEFAANISLDNIKWVQVAFLEQKNSFQKKNIQTI